MLKKNQQKTSQTKSKTKTGIVICGVWMSVSLITVTVHTTHALCLYFSQSETGGERSTSESSTNGVWQGESIPPICLTLPEHTIHSVFTCLAGLRCTGGPFASLQAAAASDHDSGGRRVVKVVHVGYIQYMFQILPGVRVIIVNPETRGPLGDSHLGEVWEKEQSLSFFCSSPVLHGFDIGCDAVRACFP